MTNGHSKVFDSAFRTVATKVPETMIPLVVELFGSDDVGDGRIVTRQETYAERYGLREADAVFTLGLNEYHFECQATSDSSMPIRMLEYDFAIGLANAGISERGFEMVLPRSCVIHLRGKPTLRRPHVRITFDDGEKMTYRYENLWLSDYNLDDIFSRHLYALLPFWPVRLEKEIDSAMRGGPEAAEVLAELGSILPRLASEIGEGSLVYNIIGSTFAKVGKYIISGSDVFSRKARSTMGGEVWELPFEKAERIAREAEDKGLKRGKAEGRAETRDAIAANMRALGLDESVIKQAIAI